MKQKGPPSEMEGGPLTSDDDYIILPTCWMNSMRLAASDSACLKSSSAWAGLAFMSSL